MSNFDVTDIKAYVNGALDYTHNAPGSIGDSAADDFMVAAYSLPEDLGFNGIIDEVRVSNTARTADWIKTCYNNQGDPSTFHSVGDEESR